MLQIQEVVTTPTLDSRDVAKMLGKKHSELLKDIRKYMEYLAEGNFPPSDFFFESQYKDTSGKKNKNYKISKKGCEFLAHKLTGNKGAIFTATYINKFNEMEKQVQLSLSNSEVDNNLVNILLENQKRLEEKLDSLLLKNDKDIAEPKKSKVELLPEDVKEMIDKMLRKKKVNYSSIMRECAKKGVDISSNTIARYHKIQKGVM